MKKLYTKLHETFTFNNRVKVLSDDITGLIEENSSVLDVGCGTGEISKIIADRKALDLKGIEVLIRKNSAIEIAKYDGEKLPFDDRSFDYVIFIDVLHHSPRPVELVKEAARVASKGIIIKDHNCNNTYQKRVLCFTDWLGNAHTGVNLEFHFLSNKRWNQIFEENNLRVTKYILPKLYPAFTRIVLWKELDFIVKLLK